MGGGRQVSDGLGLAASGVQRPDDEGLPYVKIYDTGEKVTVFKVHGFLMTKIASYLMNLHVVPRPIYITRHGESQFNTKGLIGGDSGLSPRGHEYALKLAAFVASRGGHGLAQSGADVGRVIAEAAEGEEEATNTIAQPGRAGP